jgi:hypothetical protein
MIENSKSSVAGLVIILLLISLKLVIVEILNGNRVKVSNMI